MWSNFLWPYQIRSGLLHEVDCFVSLGPTVEGFRLQSGAKPDTRSNHQVEKWRPSNKPKKPVTRKQVVAGTRTGVSPPWWCVRGAGRWRSCRSKPWEEPSWPDAEDSERFQSLKNLRRPFEGPAIGGGKDEVREESREEACLPSGRVQSR